MAGIGKTRLLAHACQQAARAGLTVLTASAAEFEAGYAWGVVRQLFGTEPGATGGGLAGTESPGDAAALAAPALGPGGPGADEDAFSILHGLYWLTSALAQRAPLLIAVDDLQWADQPSLRFVLHLARRLEGLPVLLVVTVRGPRSGGDTERVLIAELAAAPGVTVLRPAALGERACAELVRGALGRDPPAEFQLVCRELTGGNPLLLGALLASLAAEGDDGAGADVAHLRRLTPVAVSRRVLLQLGRMPAGALAAARAVAVLGTAATAARAGRLAGLDADGCARALAALMADGIIEGDQALRYVHPLVRSVVYQDLAPPLRQRWHARAARLLDADGAPAGEVTVHLLAAGPAGDSWVVARLRAAAADARTRGAPDIARLCLERALAEPPPARARPEVLAELGRAEGPGGARRGGRAPGRGAADEQAGEGDSPGPGPPGAGRAGAERGTGPVRAVRRRRRRAGGNAGGLREGGGCRPAGQRLRRASSPRMSPRSRPRCSTPRAGTSAPARSPAPCWSGFRQRAAAASRSTRGCTRPSPSSWPRPG